MQLRYVKVCEFRRIIRYISQMVQDRCIVSIKDEQEVVCALSNGDIADEPGLPLITPNHPIFYILQHLSYFRNG